MLKGYTSAAELMSATALQESTFHERIDLNRDSMLHSYPALTVDFDHTLPVDIDNYPTIT
jgi:hypothetical protein